MAQSQSASRNQTDLWHWLTRYWGFLLAVTLLLFKTHYLLLHPTLVAEDAMEHVTNTLATPWYKAFFTPHMGYYSLLNNLIIVPAVKLLPMASWALWITLGVIGTIILLLLLPYVSDSRLWRYPLQRNLIPLIIVITTLHVEYREIWMSTIHLQFFLPIGVGLILLSQPCGRKSHYFRLCFLAIAALTGVTSAILTPFFWVKAQKEKHSSHAQHACWIMVIFTLIQLAFVLSMLVGEEGMPPRFIDRSISHYMAYLSNTHILTLLFSKKTIMNAAFLQPARGLAWLIPALFFFQLYKRSSALGRTALGMLLWMSAFYFFTSTGIADKMIRPINPHHRYMLASFALLSILVVLRVYDYTQHAGNSLSQAVCMLLIANFFIIQAKNVGELSYGINYVPWSQQVKEINTDKVHSFRIMSGTGSYHYCPPSICNDESEHDITGQLLVNGTPAEKHKRWKQYANKYIAYIKKAYIGLPLPDRKDDVFYFLRIFIKDPAQVMIRCTTQKGKPMTIRYNLKKYDNLITFHYMRDTLDNTPCKLMVAFKQEMRFGIRAAAYYPD